MAQSISCKALHIEDRIPWHADRRTAEVATDPQSTPASFCFYFGPRSGFKIFWETAPRVALVFSSSMSSCCLYKKSLLNYKHCWNSVASKVAVVRTGVGFSSLKKNQIRIRFQKFCNRSRVEVWKYDSIHPGTSAHSNNNKRHVLETATTHIPTKSRLASSVWWWPAM